MDHSKSSTILLWTIKMLKNFKLNHPKSGTINMTVKKQRHQSIYIHSDRNTVKWCAVQWILRYFNRASLSNDKRVLSESSTSSCSQSWAAYLLPSPFNLNFPVFQDSSFFSLGFQEWQAVMFCIFLNIQEKRELSKRYAKISLIPPSNSRDIFNPLKNLKTGIQVLPHKINTLW